MQKRVIFIILCCTLPVLQGCFSVRPSATRSAGSAYESFFVGAEGMQYFIKPVVFKANNSGNEMHIDFTFRYKDAIMEEDSVIVNFSIFSNEIVNDLQLLSFHSAEPKTPASSAERLFAEKRKNQFVSRFTARLSLSDMIMVFSDDEPILKTHHSNNSFQKYEPTRKTRRVIKRLQNNLFVVLQ